MTINKELVRTSIDVEPLYTELLGYPPVARDGKNITYICPWHPDKNTPNLKVIIEAGKHRGSFKCFACPDVGGDVFDFVMRIRGVGFREALLTLAERAGFPVNQRPTKKNQAPCVLNPDPDKWPDHLLVWLKDRGLTVETATRFGCAYAFYNNQDHGFAIPVGDLEKDGFWKIRRYQHGDSEKKFARWPSGRKSTLYDRTVRYGENLVIVCAGELDALRAHEEGFSAVSGTIGEGTFREEWAGALRGRNVVIIYDLDKMGETGPEKVASILYGTAHSVKVVKLPEDLSEKGDLTDFFQSGRTAEDLRTLIEATPRYSPQQKKNRAGPAQPVSLSEVQETVTDAFGEVAWFVVRCCLSVCATLLIEDVANPTGLNLVGPPSSLKTTILGMFYGNEELVHVCDSFSPASFVSLAANTKESKLKEIDLLPRMKDKVFIVPELGPVFQKRKDDLVENFAILTRVFDGEGLWRDGGTGSRGYRGEHLFAWLAATTPLDYRVWTLMGKLGSRFLFLTMPDTWTSEEKKRRIVENLGRDLTYKDLKLRCREIVNIYLVHLWERNGGARSVAWNNEATDKMVLEWIANIAHMVALARSTVSVWRDKYAGSEYCYTQPTIEGPDRLSAILFNVARGHALVNGRTHLTLDDLTPVVEIGLSSMPDDRRQVMQMLLESQGGSVSSLDIERALSVSRPTARAIMKIFEVLKLGTVEEGTGQIPHTLTLADEFNWARSDEFRKLRAPEVWSWVPF